jgi:hypothetical protein
VLFRRDRRGPTEIPLPSYTSNPLPEMVCFDPTKYSCFHYEKGDNKRLSAVDPSKHASFFRNGRLFRCHALNYYSRGHRYRRNGQQVEMSENWPRGKGNSLCLVATYQCDIPVCHKPDRDKFKLTQAWFHAMDPGTYSRPNAGHALPLCRDKDCVNYYRRTKSVCWP